MVLSVHCHQESWATLAFWFLRHFGTAGSSLCKQAHVWRGGREGGGQGPQACPRAAFPPEPLQLSFACKVTPLGRVTEWSPGAHMPAFPGHLPLLFWTFILQPSLPVASDAGLWVHRGEQDASPGSCSVFRVLRFSYGLDVRSPLCGQKAPSECEPPDWHVLAREGN